MKSKKLSPLAVYLVCAAAIVLLLAADQYTKSLAVQYLKDQPSIELIPGDVYKRQGSEGYFSCHQSYPAGYGKTR